MEPLALCTKVTNLLFFINPFTLQHAELNVEKFNGSPFRSVMTTKQLVEYTVIEVAYTNHPTSHVDKRKFVLQEVTVCRTDRLGQEDSLVTVNTHLGALLHEGDTVMGYDLSTAVLNDDDMKPLQVRIEVMLMMIGKITP